MLQQDAKHIVASHGKAQPTGRAKHSEGYYGCVEFCKLELVGELDGTNYA